MYFAKERPPSPDSPYTDFMLDRFRKQGDALSDQAVSDLIQRKVHPRDWLDSIRGEAAKKNPLYQPLWEQATSVPQWADFDAMIPGKKAGVRNSILSGLALLGGSLSESYSASLGAKVLIETGRLKTDVKRRLFETANFCHAIVRSKGPLPSEPAFAVVFSVRLMHSAVRYRLLKKNWNMDYGYPVNQEDLAGTLLMFTYVFRRSLKAMGVLLTEDEEKAMHLQWRFIGHILGVAPELLTSNLNEEEQLYLKIGERQCHPDEGSRELADSLMSSMSMMEPFYLPKEALFELSRRMIGDRLATEMGYRRSPFWNAVWEAGSIPGRILSLMGRGPLEGLLESGGDWLTGQIIDWGLGEKPARYEAYF